MDHEQIKSTIVGYLSTTTKYSPAQIEETYVLKNWPLALDSFSLALLAISCDKYIKTIAPDKAIYVSEIRRKGLTVKGLVNLVITKAAT